MQQVAFFRNVNQGQRGHVTTAELLDALNLVGVHDAVAFQSNGTVVFSAPASDPSSIVAGARQMLADRGVFDDVVIARPLAFIAQIVAAHAGEADGHRRELTLFDDAQRLGDASLVALEATKRRCEVVADGDGWAVVHNERDRQSNGTPTIEAILGTPATSRGLPTLARLLARFLP